MASIRKIEGKTGTTYKITVCEGRDKAGTQIRHYKTWKPPEDMTARQIEKELKKVAYEFEKEITLGFRTDDRQTFSQYAEYYINLLEQNGRKPQTISRLKKQVSRLNEHIGHMKLTSIRPAHINAVYKALTAPGSNRSAPRAVPKVDFREVWSGSQNGAARFCGVANTVMRRVYAGTPITVKSAQKIQKAIGKKNLFEFTGEDETLTPGTIGEYASVLHSILGQAEKEMILPYNPAEKATPPLMEREHKAKSLQPEELDRIMEALRLEPIRTQALLTMYAVTGCRRGEVIGLKWDKVDFIGRQITIDTSLNYLPEKGIFEGKTKTSNVRTVPIPADTVRLLLEYKSWHDREREKWGDLWQGSEYVFTNQKGGPIHANYINAMIIDFCKRHDLPHFHPHMFRHTLASIMITNGVDVLTVSKMLGHASTSMTLDIYGHAIEEVKRSASETAADIILRKKKA